MPTMQEVRAKFPQYNDMSDEQLAGALHRKFYSDMPYDAFAAKVGLAKPQTVADGKVDRERSWGETIKDAGLSAAQGLQSGAQSMLGAVGDAQNAVGSVASWGAGQLGASPEIQGAVGETARRLPAFGVRMPTTAEINKVVEPVTGHYAPKTDIGRYSEAIGEFVPAAVTGPGGLVRKAAMAVAPGVATTLAGDVSGQNPYAKAGAAILAGIMTAGRGGSGTKELLKNVGKSEDAYAKVEAAANAAYDRLRSAGVKYDANAVDQAIGDVSKLRMNAQLSPEAAGLRDTFAQFQGRGMDFQDLDEMEQLATGILRHHTTRPADKFFTTAILNKIKDVRKSGAIATNGSVPAGEVNSLIATAKDLARRRIIARDINKMKDKSEWYLSGPESGLRNQFKNYGSKNERTLSGAEKKAFKSVVNREGFMNIAHQAGSRIVQPIVAAAGYGFGGPVGAVASVIGTQAARKFMEVYTARGVDEALKTVLAGRSAQERAAVLNALEKQNVRAYDLLATDTAINQSGVPSAGPLGVPR